MRARERLFLFVMGFSVGWLSHFYGLSPIWLHIATGIMVPDTFWLMFRDAYEYDKERGRWWTK